MPAVELDRIESLEALYRAWAELKLESAAGLVRIAQERRKLEQQGTFLVGAVRAAGDASPPPSGHEPGLAPLDQGLGAFWQKAQAQLAHAKEDADRARADCEARFSKEAAALRGRLVERVRGTLSRVRPRLRLSFRPLASGRAILHLARLSGDEPILVLHLCLGKIPTRYDFLFDDSTEDARLPPAPLYPEEGVGPSEVRPPPHALEAALKASQEAVPIKGFLPLWVPRPGGGEDFFRLLQRGPVMEVEVAEGDVFRNVLASPEAERVTGQLLRLKLEGKIELEVETG